MSTETQRVLMEAHECGSEDIYFAARPQIDTADRRRVYQAGFKDAWQAAQSSQAAEIEALKTQNEAMRAAAEKLHLVKIFMLGWKGSEPCKRNGMEQEVEQWITAFDELFSAMQTKEAS